jgi:glycosyltransferase involved in cell wall biosynthesis
MRAHELSKEEKEYEDLISWIEHTTNYCDGAVFVSNDLLREGNKHYALKSVRVIPNGVDAEHFSYQPITKKNVLFVGRFSKEKGIALLPYFIDHVMKIPDATFTAACPLSTPLAGELQKIRELLAEKEAQYKERVTIINNPQDSNGLKQLYADCQVYIQPSKYESFGLCILEAMATGRPVVAFNVGGIPEVIENKGFVVDTKQRFINKVTRLLEDNEECVKMGKEAHVRAQQFAWDVIAKRTVQYYKEILP